MKKIAFFVQWMLCGGVENALIALSKELVERGNDVTVYLLKEKGDFIKKIPESVQVKLVPMDEKIRNDIPVGGTKVTIRECTANKEYLKAIKFLIKHQINRSSFAELNVDLSKIPDLNEKYDIAVNFHMHSPFLVWYLSERVYANKKYTWIHNDFTTTNYDILFLKKYLMCVDQFFAVSTQLKKEFVEIMPEVLPKTQVALNIVPIDEICEKSEAFYPDEYQKSECLKILTVGRLEEQKGYDFAVQICKKLKKNGLKFKWYVLGDGTLRNELNKAILENGLSEYFYLLGNKMNPYPYFKYCDVYVQTSRHEGYVTTVTEAKIFNRPIVTTDVSGAREQIIDGVNGEIASIDSDSLYEKVKKIIENQNIREKYSLNLRNEEPYEIGNWITWF